MSVDVLNKNALGISKGTIGSGSTSLLTAIPELNKMFVVNIDLVHRSKQGEVKQGRVTCNAILIDTENPASADTSQKPAAEPPKGSGAGTLKLQLSHLSVSALINTGSTWDGQDPALSIKIGKHVFDTARYESRAGQY